ncbi:MAG TPA: NAD-dependent deacylase [Anaerolineales bacterium]|nr:NAD-dependent deacylase [Anaerolineales bacterium]
MRPFPASVQAGIELSAELFRNAERVVILTGAGISTPSGIPDFRSEGSGLWSREEPLEVASLYTFRTHPEKFYEWFRPLVRQIFEAIPNAAHRALAELEKAQRVHAILTQNIDMLHQKAGMQNVVELHGTLGSLSCTQCFQQVDSAPYLKPLIEQGELPRCPSCRALLKPDVILFGEQLPQRAWREAQRESRTCDLLVVAGSSLEVMPVAGLPLHALDRGAHLVIINNSPTYLNIRADAAIQENVSDIIPAIAEQVLHG